LYKIFTRSHKKNRGMASILGTIIFIGILFSAIIPMTLVMKQADNVYTINIHEREAADEDRADEALLVYAWPNEPDNGLLNINLRNTGIIEVEVIRIWVKDKPYNMSRTVNPSKTDQFTLSDLPTTPGEYEVRVLTSRGNVFQQSDNSLYYTNGVWSTPDFGITVYITNNQGRYQIQVDCLEESCPYYQEWETGFTEHIDVIKTFYVDSYLHTYRVKVYKRFGSVWTNIIEGDGYIDVTFNWPIDPPLEYVYVNGGT